MSNEAGRRSQPPERPPAPVVVKIANDRTSRGKAFGKDWACCGSNILEPLPRIVEQKQRLKIVHVRGVRLDFIIRMSVGQ